MKILAIGAHFDDVEIGCGGTLMRHRSAGHTLVLAVTSADEHRTGRPENRLDEQEAACKILGTSNLRFYNDDVESDVVGKLDKLNPDIVFTMYHRDTHQAHRRASSIGTAVGRKKNITTYYYDSGSSYDFHPQVFCKINFNRKMELIESFKSQLKCGAVNLDIIRKKEAYWAALISDDSEYAEAFVVRKLEYKV